MTLLLTKTSEAVSIGHPDKLADQIADSIFDLLRTYKKDAQSAVEVSCAADTLMVFGEIDKDVVQSTNGERSVEKANPKLTEQIRETTLRTIREIGYTEEEYNPEILVKLVTQSAEINNAVEENENHAAAAGDQGIVTGFAIAETKQYHALHFILPHHILKELEKDRFEKKIEWLKPDAKSQVTVEYEKNPDGIDVPVKIDNILLSQCHDSSVNLPTVKDVLTKRVEEIVVEFLIENHNFFDSRTLIESLTNAKILINPAGEWNDGGPAFDSGLVGRKLVVDNYGSAASIGGGATSGKNFNKVDRSGAYYARHIAKSIVKSGLAHKCLVELGFAIGVEEAVSLNIDTYGTETISLEKIYETVQQNFPLDVTSMINLSTSIEKAVESSKHGNYTNDNFPWEKTVQL